MAIYRVDYVRTYTKKYVMVEANSNKVILRGKELDKVEEYLYSIKNAIQEDIIKQNCEFKDFDVLITE